MIFDIHLVEFPCVVDSKENCYFLKSFLPGSFELFKDTFDPFYELNLLILGNFPILDLPVQDIIILFLGVE